MTDKRIVLALLGIAAVLLAAGNALAQDRFFAEGQGLGLFAGYHSSEWFDGPVVQADYAFAGAWAVGFAVANHNYDGPRADSWNIIELTPSLAWTLVRADGLSAYGCDLVASCAFEDEEINVPTQAGFARTVTLRGRQVVAGFDLHFPVPAGRTVLVHPGFGLGYARRYLSASTADDWYSEGEFVYWARCSLVVSGRVTLEPTYRSAYNGGLWSISAGVLLPTS
ncbi:MAG: hypothetical protein R6X35_01860 [Candidatus Krumholzibacteriia bacterium]